MWSRWRGRVLVFLGVMAEWDDMGYEDRDARRHELWFRVSAVVAGVLAVAAVAHASFGPVVPAVACAGVAWWARQLCERRAMPKLLMPVPVRHVQSRRGGESATFPDAPSVQHSTIESIPFDRSVGDVLRGR